ncbi:MAG: hypothetical protein AAGI90_05110 [Chlamydiota bacterium]
MSAEVCFDSIKTDLKSCYFFPDVIDALPEEVFYETEQTATIDPLFIDCKTALTLTPSAMILKIRHKKTQEEIGVYVEQKGFRFRIANNANLKNFAHLTSFFDRDLQMEFLIEILKSNNPIYELALQS